MPEQAKVQACSQNVSNQHSSDRQSKANKAKAEALSKFEQQIHAWPPTRSTLYTADDSPAEVYFPLEMSTVDYAHRVLQWTGHALREVYGHLVQENLAPPARDGPLQLSMDEMDNPRALRHALSTRAMPVYARLINMDLASFEEATTELQAAEQKLIRDSGSAQWTNMMMQKLFDMASRLVGCVSSAGFASHIQRNLSSLFKQYDQHMNDRRVRLRSLLPAAAAQRIEFEEGLSSTPQPEVSREAGGTEAANPDSLEIYPKRRRWLLSQVQVCETKVLFDTQACTSPIVDFDR
jgi:hypothetical protein